MTNIRDLLRLGHEVRLLTRISPYTTLDDCRKFYQEQGIDVRLIPWQTRKMLRYRIRDVAFVNGISWEFGKPDFLEGLAQELITWTPDVVWCHTGYAWPAAAFVKKHGVPAIIRSIDYVPANYTLKNQRDMKGYLPAKMLRYWGALMSEYRSLQNAAVHVAITPVEQKLYQKLRPKSNVQVLPLRVLPQLVKKERRQASNRHPLRVYFMGTKYTARHNFAALNFILDEIIPLVRKRCPGAFEFHILGQRVPPELLTQGRPMLFLMAMFLIWTPILPTWTLPWCLRSSVWECSRRSLSRCAEASPPLPTRVDCPASASSMAKTFFWPQMPQSLLTS